MAKNRMAGEEMQKDKNWDARARIFKADRERADEKLGRIDREKYDLSGHSEEDIFMAMKGSTFDSNDYERLTGKPAGGGNGGGDEDTDVSIQPVPTIDPKPEPGSGGGGGQIIQPGNPGEVGGGGPGTGIDNSTNVNVNQDNDIITDIVGNGNSVTNNQDNSVNTIGGRVGSFSGDRGSMFKDNWMTNFFS